MTDGRSSAVRHSALRRCSWCGRRISASTCRPRRAIVSSASRRTVRARRLPVQSWRPGAGARIGRRAHVRRRGHRLAHQADAVFPNNWVSFHDDGTIVLYRCRRRIAASTPSGRARGGRAPTALPLPASADLSTRSRPAAIWKAPQPGARSSRARGLCVPFGQNRRIAGAEWARAMHYEPEVFDAAGPDGARSITPM